MTAAPPAAAARRRRVPQRVPFEEIMKAADVPDAHELESLLVDCVYTGLLVGALDQRASLLHVVSCAGRDVERGRVWELAARLEEWCVCARAGAGACVRGGM